MKITAGPARVIKARAAKLEIRWKSMPMANRKTALQTQSKALGLALNPLRMPL